MKILCIVLSVITLIAGTILVVFCVDIIKSNPNLQNENITPKEEPHLYWKDIDVVVTDINKKHWYATVHRYEIDVTVHSEEYGLTKTLSVYSSGPFVPEQWDLERGDTIKVKMNSWVMDSTGQVVRREIQGFS